jgi:hypothetical protein
MSLTLRQFIIAAIAQGCTEKFARRDIPGSTGPLTAQYLAKGKLSAILPNVRESDPLTPTVLAYLVRTLALTSFDDDLGDGGS